MRRAGLVAILALFLGGCSHYAKYQPDYFAPELANVQPSIEGQALVVTEPIHDEKVFSQHPSSLTGAGLTFKAKIGEFVRDMTVSVLARKFKGGAVRGTEVPTGSAYRIVVKPEVLNFDYEYNQLKNLGFAITPQAQVDLYAYLYDANGKKLMEKKYSSGFVSGGTYLISLKPPERVNRALHQALFLAVSQLANDIEQQLR